MNLHLPSCARFFARVEKHLYVFGPREEAVGSVRLRRNLLSSLPLPLLLRKNNLYERRSLRPPFPTFALGLIKDFSLSLSLFFTSQEIAGECKRMIYGRKNFASYSRPDSYHQTHRICLGVSAKNNTPGNPVRLLPALFHRNETKRGEAKRFTIGLAIARNVERSVKLNLPRRNYLAPGQRFCFRVKGSRDTKHRPLFPPYV